MYIYIYIYCTYYISLINRHASVIFFDHLHVIPQKTPSRRSRPRLRRRVWLHEAPGIPRDRLRPSGKPSGHVGEIGGTCWAIFGRIIVGIYVFF